MIAGLVQGLLRQGFGEPVSSFAQPRIRGGVPVSIDLVATAFSQNLELILRPPA